MSDDWRGAVAWFVLAVVLALVIIGVVWGVGALSRQDVKALDATQARAFDECVEVLNLPEAACWERAKESGND